ncbi:SGNH/GDSL hydrolase family protein [Listeria valentina]|uniref:SGNH/GDSL hydrolase family protein n=1 Tax=Listeria valentina TaxID=2705293 RepID=UPI0014315E56|nr:SGNH/GDSL hydrolase family protein [Listeria valentina]
MNENWSIIESYLGIGMPSPAEVVSTLFPLSPESLEGAQLENYFNKERIEKDKSIANLTGELVTAVGANVSAFIRIKDLDVLGCNYNYNTAGCFYDANFRYVTFVRFVASGTSGWYTLTPPENAVYIRVVVNSAHLDQYMLRASAEKPAQYYPYQVSIPWLQSDKALSGKKIVTFGDSITWQDGQTIDNVTLQGYQSYMRQAGAIVTNEGVGNMSFAQSSKAGAEELYLYKKIVLDKYDLAGTDIVTIACGTNDVAFDVVAGEIGTITSTEFDTSTSFGALRGILEYIRSHFPTVDIYLMTPLQNKTRDMVKHQEMADGIMTIGGFYGAPVFDLFRRSGIGKYTFDTYTRDGLHPNNAGYALYGPRIVRMLEAE